MAKIHEKGCSGIDASGNWCDCPHVNTIGLDFVPNRKSLMVNEYQEAALETAVYPESGHKSGFEYTMWGMLGEAGEMANKYKKLLRKRQSYADNREMLMDELGDVLWYAAAVAYELGYPLEEVMQYNLKKLAERQATGTLKDHK